MKKKSNCVKLLLKSVLNVIGKKIIGSPIKAYARKSYLLTFIFGFEYKINAPE